jgi:hypothetical protein
MGRTRDLHSRRAGSSPAEAAAVHGTTGGGVDWSWYQPGLISPVTRVRLPPPQRRLAARQDRDRRQSAAHPFPRSSTRQSSAPLRRRSEGSTPSGGAQDSGGWSSAGQSTGPSTRGSPVQVRSVSLEEPSEKGPADRGSRPPRSLSSAVRASARLAEGRRFDPSSDHFGLPGLYAVGQRAVVPSGRTIVRSSPSARTCLTWTRLPYLPARHSTAGPDPF